jgi:hypothetical protein
MDGRIWLLYKPAQCTWEQAYALAMSTLEQIKAKRLIELRIAYAGCFVAKYYMGSQRVGDKWVDLMQEVKVYDNTPYLEDITCEQKREG